MFEASQVRAELSPYIYSGKGGERSNQQPCITQTTIPVQCTTVQTSCVGHVKVVSQDWLDARERVLPDGTLRAQWETAVHTNEL